MKTFDEAFKVVNQSKRIDIDLQDFGKETLQNDAFTALVIKLVEAWMNGLQSQPNERCMAFSCSFVQSVFNLGMRVGVEMEKQ